MNLSITFAKAPLKSSDTAVLLAHSGAELTKAGKAFDKTLKGLITHALESSGAFTGENGQSLTVTLPKNADFKRVLVLGLGEKNNAAPATLEIAGGKLIPALKATGANTISFFTDIKDAEHLAAGAKLRAYGFEKFKTQKDDKPKPELKKITLIHDDSAAIKARYKRLDSIIDGVYLARNLVNEPPNTLYPDAYANLIKAQLKPLGVTVEILDEKKMDKLGMGGIMNVGKGSARAPRMVIMRYNGASKAPKTYPIALVGKGVTFDTGGISIKPGAGMDEMKMDMGGSAAVVGAIKAIAARKAKVNVVGIVGLAENMPSSNAYRPGDIITTYSGKTVEILNTDAEGRLVLADCLTYIQEKYKPEAIIDLATLTGAMMVALGHEYCGTFVNKDKFWQSIEKAGNGANEKLWRMPLDEVWKKDMVSNVADLQNLAKSGRFAGACTAAGFLEHFIDKGRSWAHMDIAGTAWKKSDGATTPKYATGFGVRTLEQLIHDAYENK